MAQGIILVGGDAVPGFFDLAVRAVVAANEAAGPRITVAEREYLVAVLASRVAPSSHVPGSRPAAAGLPAQLAPLESSEITQEAMHLLFGIGTVGAPGYSETAEPGQGGRPSRLRRLGDSALFLVGFHWQRARRLVMGEDFLIAAAERAYLLLAEERKVGLYQQIAGHVPHLVDVARGVADLTQLLSGRAAPDAVARLPRALRAHDAFLEMDVKGEYLGVTGSVFVGGSNEGRS